jgi:hypothetical protein
MTTRHNFARTGYIVTEAALAALAKDYVTGVGQTEGVRGTYLQILVAHSRRELETAGVKRATTEAALAAVQRAHDALYPIILAAITTEDIAPDEDADAAETRRRTKARNVRSGFARSSKTTLTQAIKAGERLAALDPATVTKELLQARYAQVRAGPGTATERIARVRGTLERLIRELAEDDKAAAVQAVKETQSTLRAALKPEPEPEPEKPAAVRQLTRTKMKRGELTLHPH